MEQLNKRRFEQIVKEERFDAKLVVARLKAENLKLTKEVLKKLEEKFLDPESADGVNEMANIFGCEIEFILALNSNGQSATEEFKKRKTALENNKENLEKEKNNKKKRVLDVLSILKQYTGNPETLVEGEQFIKPVIKELANSICKAKDSNVDLSDLINDVKDTVNRAATHLNVLKFYNKEVGNDIYKIESALGVEIKSNGNKEEFTIFTMSNSIINNAKNEKGKKNNKKLISIAISIILLNLNKIDVNNMGLKFKDKLKEVVGSLTNYDEYSGNHKYDNEILSGLEKIKQFLKQEER